MLRLHVITDEGTSNGPIDNMLFTHEFTLLLMQIKALFVLIVCMLSYFKYISIILYNFML